jgi:formate dehydrogenase major subunit
VLRLTVDGRAVSAPTETKASILDAAAEAGIEVPTLCADPRLTASGACRLCVVEIDGDTRPVAACTTPVRDGMVIRTRTPALEGYRRSLLRMLARRYPRHVVAQAPEEPFHRLLRAYGLGDAPEGPHDPSAAEDPHPTIRVDLERCISCWRCVRICDEVQGQFSWRVVGRGKDTRLMPDSGTTLAASSCVACGACVDTCPTGALEDRSVLSVGTPTRWTRTTCPYCGVGCELLVGTRDGRIAAVTPALDAPVNRGHLCVKGRAGHGFVDAPDRVTVPLVRESGSWAPVSWEQAIDLVAQRFAEIMGRDGAGAIGVLGSARATNEDNYVLQKFARTVLGTNNIDCCARVCHSPSAAALRRVFGTGAATSSFEDIENARTILVWGSNTTENHPVVGARIKQAARRGAHLIVVDPRVIELAAYADVHLQPRPGTNLLLLHAMAHVIFDEQLVDGPFAATRIRGLEEYRAFVAAFPPEMVSAATGVDAGAIRVAARLYASERPAISFHGLGLTEHHQGTENVMGLANLALLTGNLGHPGAGVNPLRGQNNVQGAAHMGCEPSHLPGYAPIDEARARVAAAWGARIPPEAGLDAIEMLDAAESGALKALWVMGWDLLLTQPNANATARALGNLDFVVIQDLFLNETAQAYGSVFLPAASAFEKDGTFMNSERRVQRVRAVLPAPDGTKPDWEAVADVAAAMGHGDRFQYRDPVEIWEEIRRVWLPGAGITYPRLEAPGGLQWPCPGVDHPGTPRLHADSFPGIGPAATLSRLDPQPPVEVSSDEFPFVLVTGRGLYQFNAGTMTRRAATGAIHPDDRLEVSDADASRLHLVDGQRVRIRSRYGEAVLAIAITDRLRPGTLFATFSDPAVSINRVTGPHRDPYTHTPEYKVTAVELAAT